MKAASFSVSTCLFGQSQLDREHLVDIAAHGFDGIELVAGLPHFDATDLDAVAQLREWLDDTRLTLTSVHAPTGSIASSEPAARRQAVAAVCQALDLARVMPYPVLVLPVGTPVQVSAHDDNDAAAARRSLDELMPYAASRGVQVALKLQTNALSTPDALEALIADAADWPTAGICLDMGHARLLGDPVDAIEATAEHLVAAHVHDSRGSRDDRLVPYDGSIDWARALLSFQKVGFAGPWTFALAPTTNVVATLSRAALARQRFEQCLGINDELMSQ